MDAYCPTLGTSIVQLAPPFSVFTNATCPFDQATPQPICSLIKSNCGFQVTSEMGFQVKPPSVVRWIF